MLIARSPTRSRSVLILTADDNRAEIHGHRLVQREQLEAAVVDLDVQLVDRPVAVEHARDRVGIAPDEAVDRGAHAVLGKTAHLEQPRLQLLELVLKMRRCVLTCRLSRDPVSGPMRLPVAHSSNRVAIPNRPRGYPNRPVT